RRRQATTTAAVDGDLVVVVKVASRPRPPHRKSVSVVKSIAETAVFPHAAAGGAAVRHFLSLLLSVPLVSALQVCACSHHDEESAAPRPMEAGAPDAPASVALTRACVTSPKPTPFPSGDCNAPKPKEPDLFDTALAAIKLDRCSLALAKKDL